MSIEGTLTRNAGAASANVDRPIDTAPGAVACIRLVARRPGAGGSGDAQVVE